MENQEIENLGIEGQEIEDKGIKKNKVFRDLGLGLFVMLLTIVIAQIVVAGIMTVLWPTFAEGSWFLWTVIGVSFYGVGFPAFILMTKHIPNGPKGEEKKMSLLQIGIAFFISMAGVYLFNIVGMLINMLIGFIKGSTIANPLEGVLDGASLLAILLFVGILSPIVEEIVFRGILLDKLRGYGDKTAIVFTALAFGLFHGNLSQFFYAFVLGLFFGYIAMKTNTIKYTVLLHIVINILGSVIMPFLALSENQILAGIAGLGVIAMIAIGIALYILTIKQVQLEPSQLEIEPETKEIYFNIGMILFYIVCLGMFIMAILA